MLVGRLPPLTQRGRALRVLLEMLVYHAPGPTRAGQEVGCLVSVLFGQFERVGDGGQSEPAGGRATHGLDDGKLAQHQNAFAGQLRR